MIGRAARGPPQRLLCDRGGVVVLVSRIRRIHLAGARLADRRGWLRQLLAGGAEPCGRSGLAFGRQR